MDTNVHSKGCASPFAGHGEDAGQLEDEERGVVPAESSARGILLALGQFEQMGGPNVDEATTRLSLTKKG